MNLEFKDEINTSNINLTAKYDQATFGKDGSGEFI